MPILVVIWNRFQDTNGLLQSQHCLLWHHDIGLVDIAIVYFYRAVRGLQVAWSEILQFLDTILEHLQREFGFRTRSQCDDLFPPFVDDVLLENLDQYISLSGLMDGKLRVFQPTFRVHSGLSVTVFINLSIVNSRRVVIGNVLRGNHQRQAI